MKYLRYSYLRTILLCVAIVLIAVGIYTSNYISMCIGGFIIGVYNIIIIDEED